MEGSAQHCDGEPELLNKGSKHTNVPALSHDDPKKEEDKQDTAADPSVRGVGGRFVQVALVYLCTTSMSVSS